MVTWLWKLGLAELILLLLCWDNCAMEVPLDLRQPPTITKQSAQDHIVDPRDSAVVECEAKGNPAPAFSWKRNGRAFQLGADPRVSMRSRSGTLDIAFYSGVPPEDYEGEYQCFANNDFGTAVSSKINLRVSRAPLWPKEVLEPVAINQGLPLVLPCNPPPSLPPPHIFWMNSSMMPIIPDRRISVGLNGDLYFSNVLVNDSRTTYSCNARYAQTIQQKNPFPLKVLTTRLISESLPRFLSPTGSASTKVVLRGEQLALECIAAGVPTPYIRWYKRGGELPIRKLRLENFNKTLRVLTASDENSGEYVCSATNRMGTISHTIVVRVEAAPTWLTKPTNLVLPAEQNGRLVCRANGVPKPTIQWMVNGEPVERVPLNPRRQVEGENLVLRSVQTIDSAVYQCNASNDHGYLLANAFISIQESSPRILSPRNQLVRVVQNSRASLECIFFGSPIPQLRWSKDGQVSSLEGGSYKTYHNGTLEIQRAKAEDRGYYTCAASNVLGRAENQVRLEVKDPTKITRGPKDPKPIRGSEARLECRASHDESLPVTVTWLRNNKALSLGWRLSKEGDFLVIPRVQREDEGNYTCIVRTELDRVSASARLTVFDRPDPPTDLELSDPSERSIRLTWIPGDDNHSPVTEFLVQYEEDYWEPRWWKNLTSYPGNLNSVMLQLRPFVNYQFRVIAINAIGPGRPSRPSQRYKTGGAAPDAIPRYIRGIGTWRTRMVIRWEALRNIERNGPHLRYLVWWRRRDSREEWKNTTTYWLKHIIYDADTFTPYEIKVQAMNDFGVGPESDVVIGYSGEDRPIAAPTNLRVSKTDSTRATLHWDPVPQSTVLGILKEYKVYYWRDRSLLKWLGVSRRRNSMGFNTTSVRPYGVLTGLIPYSNYKMYMVVANNRYEGPPSSTIEFQTTEGVPSPPRFFSIQQRHLDTFYLEWDRPAEPNGILTGYTLKYHRGNGTSDGFTQLDFPPNTTYYTLRRPDRYTRFKFSLAARTQVGIGEANVQESPLFTNEAYSREQVDLATQGWFIGMMCAVALLVVILLIVCFIKKSRGGKYPVRDKKDLPLDTVEPKDQNGSFDYRSFERINRVSTLPYNKRSDEDHRPLRSSQISLDGMVKMQESDDSLVDYGEGGDGQFNEDGSFIGQYIARKDRDETEGISPSANSPINAIYSLA